MKISDALRNVESLYVETAPFIYFTERYPAYIERMHSIFQYVSNGNLEIVTSTITLTETLTKPLRDNDQRLTANYLNLFQNTRYVRLISIDAGIATRAAQLRSTYSLKTPDALQVATAIAMGCQAFLTNDAGIKRVHDLAILMVDELELDLPPNEVEHAPA